MKYKDQIEEGLHKMMDNLTDEEVNENAQEWRPISGDYSTKGDICAYDLELIKSKEKASYILDITESELDKLIEDGELVAYGDKLRVIPTAELIRYTTDGERIAHDSEDMLETISQWKQKGNSGAVAELRRKAGAWYIHDVYKSIADTGRGVFVALFIDDVELLLKYQHSGKKRGK